MKEEEKASLQAAQVRGLIRDLADAVRAEALRATNLHGPFASAHEAYGVLLEEVEEFWDEVKKNGADRSLMDMRSELIQVAAVAIKAAASLTRGARR